MIEKIVTGSFETNTYIISDNTECIIVDPGLDFLEYASSIKKKYSVVAILLTHGHMDHIDGVRYFSNVPIYIHEADEEFFYDSRLSLYSWMNLKSPFKKGDLKIITVKDNDELELMGLKFKVIHTPGHTRGSVCYLYRNKILSGDTLFKNSCGRTDFPTGDALDLRRSLNKLISLPDNLDVYPGHDEKTKLGEEKKRNPFINRK